jgi:hypothetical protein
MTSPPASRPQPAKPAKRINGRRMKEKGSEFERELAAYLNARLNLQSSRAPLSGGGKVGLSGGADLLGTPGLFVEAKRVESLNIREALRQAVTNVRKTASPEAPVVIARRNRETTGESLVALRLDDFLTFYHAFLLYTGTARLQAPPVLPEPDPLPF